ncbi:MAG: hypothetical protein WBD41_17125 [Rhodococcus sp. (in: high G+C Gram-positive bacteria)]|jgi:hypothetical protein|uniref:hypothetical protein n=1 Tax=Rhodococcus sp. EPR-157 TaxID=1813677 RepID=UPI000AE50C58|nr:hypothetical protein [Rhodococcus sp. EPR-157]
MLIRSLGVACLTCGVIIGFASAATAAVPRTPPASVVGLAEDEAIAELIDGGYTPRVISRHGGGPECIVFNQVAVTDPKQIIKDAEIYEDDDEYSVLLAVNCTS